MDNEPNKIDSDINAVDQEIEAMAQEMNNPEPVISESEKKESSKTKKLILFGILFIALIGILVYLLSNNSKYEVVFEADGGSYTSSQTIKQGEKIKKPKDPTKDGYEFIGWFTEDGKEYDFSKKVEKKVKLVAKWEKLDDYSVTLKVEDKEKVFSSQGGKPIDLDGFTDFDKEGFDIEWYVDDEKIDITTYKIKGNTIITGKYVEAETFTVTFNSNGGSEIPAQKVIANKKATKPVDPVKEGYVLEGWFLGGSEYDFDKEVTEDIILEAKWLDGTIAKTYTVTFNSDGGSEVAAQTIMEGKKATKPNRPTKEGYVFKEWQLDGKTFNFNDTEITKDITLIAIWEKEANKYTVTFDSAGGSAVSKQIVIENGKVTKPSDPVRTGYEFKGWKLNGNNYDFNTAVTADMTLVAEWRQIPTYTVTFNSDGGSSVATQTVNEGGKATKPSNPTKSEYAFVKWKLNGSEYNFNTPVTKNITLVAEWRKLQKYTVTFDSAGGSSVPSQTILEGGKVTKPSNPTRSGYTFSGWKLNNKDVDFNTLVVNSNITIVAAWTRVIPNYTVAFDSAGGSRIPSQTIAEGGKATRPSDPTRSGYRFVKWNLNGSEYNFDTAVTGNITLVAEWAELPKYTVTFNSDGGSEVSSQTISEGGKATKPSDPTKVGHTFNGWKLNGNSYNFDTPITGNITLVASWVQKTYIIVKTKVDDYSPDVNLSVREGSASGALVSFVDIRYNGSVVVTSSNPSINANSIAGISTFQVTLPGGIVVNASVN